MRETFKVLAFLISSAALANSASVNPSYNDLRKIDEVVSYSTSSDSNLIELNNGYDYISLRGIRKINANFISLNKDVNKVTPKGFDWSVAGLFPIYNSYILHSKAFNNYTDYTGHQTRIPFDVEDLNEWKNGDSVYYSAVGGIGMFLSVGKGSIGVGPKVFIEGGFSVYVEKKSKKDVFVEIRKVFTKNIALIAGTWGVFAEKARLEEATKGINFNIDISTRNGQEIYERLIRVGHADFAQEDETGVVRTGTVNSTKKTHLTKAAISTPFIPFIELVSQRQLRSYDESRGNIWNQESDIIDYQHQKKRSHRLFSHKGEFTRELNLRVEKKSIKNASYRIFKKRNHFRKVSLEKGLKQLTQYTQLSFFKEKELVFGNQKLKYINMEASLVFGERILKNFNQFMGKDSIKSSTKAFKKYLKKKGFPVIHKLVKRCGGSLNLVIEGELITRHTQTRKYPSTAECELN